MPEHLKVPRTLVYQTSNIELPEPNTLPCGISALIFASGMSAAAIGIDVSLYPPTMDKAQLLFKQLNEILKKSTRGGRALVLERMEMRV
jgi:hypothetical protein